VGYIRKGKIAFRSFMGRFPAQRLAIIALSNDEHNERLNARWQIADFYIKDQMKAEEVVAAREPAAGNLKTEGVKYGSRKEFEGEYFGEEVGTWYSFIVGGDVLVMRHWKLGEIELKRLGENKFSGSGEEVFAFEIEFEKEKGRVNGVRVTNFGVRGMWFGRMG
jgi:hypothetical protein